MNNVAIYARVSKDDLDNSMSVSIKYQIEYIKDYLIQNQMDFVDIYIDDGYSGGTFDRPDFIRMMSDIDLKYIDCIVIKDLSRLGRNYLDVGMYLEHIFPEKGVRVISINDNYDSAKENDDTIAIRNFLNGLYLKECKRKARLQVKRRCVSKNMSIMGQYGYMMDENKNIIIDPETAPIVKRIFEMYLNHISYHKIAEILTEEKIINPGYYRYLRLGKASSMESIINKPNYNPYLWNHSTVRKIIRDEEYTGVAVNRIYSRENGKTLKRVEPYKVNGTHEAIISKEVYLKCQEIRDKRTSETKESDYQRLKRKVICSKCNKVAKFALYYGYKRENDQTYYCTCCKSRVSANKLHDELYKDSLFVIQNVKKNSFKQIFKKQQFSTIELSYDDLIKESNKIELEYETLFERKMNEEITEEEYKYRLEELKVRTADIKNKLELFNPNLINDRLYDYNYDKFLLIINNLEDLSKKFEVIDQMVRTVGFEYVDGKLLLDIKYNL